MPPVSKALKGFLLAALPFSAGAPHAALAGDPRFRIVLNWTSESIAPPRREFWNHFELNFVLIGGRQIEERTSRDPSPTKRWSPNQNRTVALGDQYAVGQWPAIWRIVDDRTLIRIVAYPSHSWIVRVRTDGQSSCSATFEWRLKDGFTEFQGWSEARKTATRYVNPIARKWRCEVLQQT